ncbi:MAG: HAD family hydrolase [Candidatus Pacearchaeota archaeon]|nr:HAD family hydrolase [Candidatus Pacearchaeota archaeon]
MIKILIFDFDGTIVDTKEVYFKMINKHLNKIGIGKRQIEKTIKLGMNLYDSIREMIPSRIYSWWLKEKITREIVKEIKDIKKCKNVDAIKEFKTKKILISNSYSDFVRPIIKHLKLKKYFNEIYCADDFRDKADFIKKYLKLNEIDANRCLYIGDRVSDIKLAKKVGCYSIIILGKCAWDSRKEIMKEKPDFIISDLSEIREILRKFNSV